MSGVCYSATPRRAVIDEQNEVTNKVLARCEGRGKLKQLISSIMDHPKRGLPWKRGSEYLSFLSCACVQPFHLSSATAWTALEGHRRVRESCRLHAIIMKPALLHHIAVVCATREWAT